MLNNHVYIDENQVIHIKFLDRCYRMEPDRHWQFAQEIEEIEDVEFEDSRPCISLEIVERMVKGEIILRFNYAFFFMFDDKIYVFIENGRFKRPKVISTLELLGDYPGFHSYPHVLEEAKDVPIEVSELINFMPPK